MADIGEPSVAESGTIDPSPQAPSVRDTLMDAAGELFYLRGIGATSMRDIAGMAGVAQSTIYNHFASKDELAFAVLVRSHQRVNTHVEAILHSAGPSPQLLLDGLRMHALQHMHRIKEMSIFDFQHNELLEWVRKRVRELAKAYEGRFQLLLSDLVAEGSVSCPNPRERTRMLLNAGITLGKWYKEGGPLTRDQMADIYVQMCADALHLDVAGPSDSRRPAGRGVSGSRRSP